MGKTAIILGATGLTGKLLLNRLLADESYETVKVFSRRVLGLEHPKLDVYVGDLLKLEHFQSDFTGDELFCCIGTTAKKTKDKAIYKKIDYGIPVAAAKLCKKNGVESFTVVSALGADASSRIFYNRIKGEMEQEVLNLKIRDTYILRPSLIKGLRIEKRLGEAIASCFMNLIQVFLVGRYRKYRAIEAETIASAMHQLNQIKPDDQIFESDRIQEFGQRL